MKDKIISVFLQDCEMPFGVLAICLAVFWFGGATQMKLMDLDKETR